MLPFSPVKHLAAIVVAIASFEESAAKRHFLSSVWRLLQYKLATTLVVYIPVSSVLPTGHPPSMEPGQIHLSGDTELTRYISPDPHMGDSAIPLGVRYPIPTADTSSPVPELPAENRHRRRPDDFHVHKEPLMPLQISDSLRAESKEAEFELQWLRHAVVIHVQALTQ